jgi:hypothetical protein
MSPGQNLSNHSKHIQGTVHDIIDAKALIRDIESFVEPCTYGIVNFVLWELCYKE